MHHIPSTSTYPLTVAPPLRHLGPEYERAKLHFRISNASNKALSVEATGFPETRHTADVAIGGLSLKDIPIPAVDTIVNTLSRYAGGR